MDKPEPQHNRDELLRAAADLLVFKDGKRGLTTGEITEALGISRRKVQVILAKLHKEGRLIRESAMVETYDGSIRPTTAYLIKPDDD
jgi:DNA-binding transcriptional regulator LsrR (DeoR family)